MKRSLKSSGLPGGVAYAMLLLWFLLTVLAARSAQAADASALTASDMLPAIEAALMENGASAEAEITLADPGAIVGGVDPQIEHVSYNPATGRFVVRIAGTAVAGFAKVSERYPALLSDLARGDLITEENVGWVETADARSDAILNAEGLIGMEARRSLAAGAPIRKNDVIAPVLVKRGALVTMTYSMTGLALSEAAVAQATGAKGDVVEVKNVKSDRLIRAVVEGKNQVRVLSSRVAQMEPRQ